MSSSAVRSRFANAATGTLRLLGRMATVLRLRLDGTSSSAPGVAVGGRWLLTPTSFVTREAMSCSSLIVVAGCLQASKRVASAGQRWNEMRWALRAPNGDGVEQSEWHARKLSIPYGMNRAAPGPFRDGVELAGERHVS